MAMSSVIRKASPTVVPLALRAISSPRINLTGSFPSEKEASFLSNQFSSAVAVDNNNVHDKKFLKVLISEINLAKRLDSEKRVLQTPNDFPFTIEDDPCSNSITLERMLHGEQIKVVVNMPNKEDEDEEEESSDDESTMTSDEEEEEKSITTLPMHLEFSKENGDSLEFKILASPDEITIKKMWKFKNIYSSYKYMEGPKFETLASDMQYCLKKFIRTKGIDKNNVEFLCKYMVEKSKPSPTVVPLALRAISSPRINLTGSFPSEKEASFLSNQFSSAAAVDGNNVHDKKFLKVLIPEINSEKKVLQTPNDFPFTIKDNPRSDSIALERMLHGEKIEVVVNMPNKEDEDEDEEESSSDDESTMTSENSITTLPMSLKFSKENGESLKFKILASSDEITIKKMWKYKRSYSSYEYMEGPKFETLASDVQYCLKKFIRTRGIDKNNVEFLYKYMVEKSKRNDMLWNLDGRTREVC
ncbi:hypothetical protein ACJIZ3_024076 [Penstemon smallii]|uniref:Uncharacterized protein n=1 Tax=Penstemon smallii TaxID=265156 RepID=A0ABD3TT75_9LAMI